MSELNDLCEKVERHKVMLDDHLEQYKKDREENREILDCLRESQKTSTEALMVMTDFAQKANPMLDAWLAADGTIKTMAALGRFMKWASGFTILAAAIQWIIDNSH